MTGVLFAFISLCGRLCAEEIYRESSQFNTIIVSEDGNGLRKMMFEEGGSVQSAGYADRPGELTLAYTKATMAALAVVPAPKRVCIIGLGGGSMAMFLRHVLPEVQIDAVELDPAVVDVAKKYFGFVEDAKLKVHVGDGRAFIEKTDAKYDVIFLDAYGADYIPYSLATVEFLRAVRARLAEGGVVSANVWSLPSNKLYFPMLRTYGDAFGEVLIVKASASSGNRIFLATAEKAEWPKQQLVVSAERFAREHAVGYDLAGIIQRGLMEESVPAGTQVLMDAGRPGE